MSNKITDLKFECFCSIEREFCDGSCNPINKITIAQPELKEPLHVEKFVAQNSVVNILRYAKQDPDREGLADTPKRYIKFLDQFLNPDPFEFTTFTNEGCDEMVHVKDIPFYSLCEHHIAPFFGTATVAYIPNAGKIVGLSKIPRTVDMFARRLQNQERITTQIANYIKEKLEPKGVAVVLKARHLCVEMRGIEKTGVITTTSCMLGVFKDDANCRQEFLNLIR